ncbi:MAG TPA: LuxR C-terminal-related transcriptional regulator [Solirubrobacteraceae bacterium]|nr:LuxR C-terminal-related transcriptional regulator [Solirubrobacteraceae bacterium]
MSAGASVHSSSAPAANRGEWSRLFASAFAESRNAMVLLDSHRRLVDANGAHIKLVGFRRAEIVGRPFYEHVVGGPLATQQEWVAALAKGRFTGEAPLRAADGSAVNVQWAATVEVVTGHRMVLFVALSTSRWGPRFRRAETSGHEPEALSEREREIVRLVALGSSGPEIADELHIAHNTVRTHVRNAMTKSGARSRAQLVAKALGDGLIFK